MREALNTSTGTLHTAQAFDRLSDSQKASLRSLLVCPGCRRPAHFRSRSSDGRAACFYSRHADSCDTAAPEWSTREAAEARHVRSIDNDGTIKQLRLDPLPAAGAPTLGKVAGPGAGTGQARRHDGRDDASQRHTHTQGLHSLHRAIDRDHSLARSDDPIKLPDRDTPLAHHEAILTPRQITDEHIGTYRMVWGQITSPSVAETSGSAFLDGMHASDGSTTSRLYYTLLRDGLCADLLTRREWDAIGQARRCSFLAYGRLRRDATGVPFINVDSLAHLSLLGP